MMKKILSGICALVLAVGMVGAPVADSGFSLGQEISASAESSITYSDIQTRFVIKDKSGNVIFTKTMKGQNPTINGTLKSLGISPNIGDAYAELSVPSLSAGSSIHFSCNISYQVNMDNGGGTGGTQATALPNFDSPTKTVAVGIPGINNCSSSDDSIKISLSYSLDSSSGGSTPAQRRLNVNVPDQIYTGKELRPAPTVTYDGKVLKEGTDYTVSYSNNINIGYGAINILGKNGYTFGAGIMFRIIPANVSGLKATATGQTAIKLGWNAVKGATGYVVYRYNPTTKSWVRLGVTKANSYMATGLTGGTTYAFTARAYTTVGGKNVYDSANLPKLFTTTNPAAPYFAVASTAKGRAYVKWNKVAGASGYVVYYRTSKGSWQRAGVVKNTVTSFTQNGLRSGTAYAFAVRAYRTYGGKNYYGAFNQRGVLIK